MHETAERFISFTSAPLNKKSLVFPLRLTFDQNPSLIRIAVNQQGYFSLNEPYGN